MEYVLSHQNLTNGVRDMEGKDIKKISQSEKLFFELVREFWRVRVFKGKITGSV